MGTLIMQLPVCRQTPGEAGYIRCFMCVCVWVQMNQKTDVVDITFHLIPSKEQCVFTNLTLSLCASHITASQSCLSAWESLWESKSACF